MDRFLTLQDNRAFLYGDAVFETLKVLDNKVLFSEDHYFRLMASMRILRMEIPINFTLEYFENQILEAARNLKIESSARVRFNVFRKNGGLYLPQTNEVDYFSTATPLENTIYTISSLPYEVDIYKDFVITKQLLSTIKSTNRTINTTGSIYANENNLDNCLLLNHEKNIIEALNGNIFMIKDGILTTPPLSEGCINGIMRKQLLLIAQNIETLKVEERPISPFELQKADELFISNVIRGIQPITRYRKKEYQTSTSELLVLKLNTKIRLF
ncbi:aminotransferase class IV [Flavobacterium columnare]|uniref:branched-chain-amino-acid transaminase n=2 Tax=Flavobacterium columnare TaxID=996 RepID=G8X8H0_FLACA|nr:aminotransferase class IV [Flavobacterium columnare]AEW85804.1 branched-chain amino acid aminotransferase/4-amino-4-deoxychorismate lyase [Flavobacterium columnare ATCC 49512]AMO18978.1 aminotransferase class IV [Flavobacterium columnare]AUX16894.1 aminotransferase class IV [Flavobacterium columnare]MBF6654659.1 aminotransferase class IV [Flavobacterium columnare]MBF6657141.1 aminotransferase class IV [Flavobacterium columnare]